MSRNVRIVCLALVVVAGLLFVGCSNLASALGISDGKDGAAGATGAEGPTIYLVSSTGERIYSGGSVFLGQTTTSSTTLTVNLQVVNKTKQALYFKTTGSKVQGGSSYYSTGSSQGLYTSAVNAADAGIASEVSVPSGGMSSAFDLSFSTLSIANGIYRRRFTIPLFDDAANASGNSVISFEAYGIYGS